MNADETAANARCINIFAHKNIHMNIEAVATFLDGLQFGTDNKMVLKNIRLPMKHNQAVVIKEQKLGSGIITQCGSVH